MFRSLFFAAALTLLAAATLPALGLGGSADAASCTRVYTTSGWITRC